MMKLKGLLRDIVEEYRKRAKETEQLRKEAPPEAYMSSGVLFPWYGGVGILEFGARQLGISETTLWKIVENKCFET